MGRARGVQPSEWRQHGTLLIPSIAGISLVSVHGYSLGVMMGPLEQEFGWSRAQISAGGLIISFLSLLFSPFVGAVIDRVGPRAVAITGVIAYSVMLAWLSTISADIGSWWLHWSLLGLASTIILPTVWTAAVNSVFIVNRGKALAITLLGTGLSATFVPSLASALIDRFGWRGAYVAMAAIIGGVVLLLVLTLFHGAPRQGRSGNAGRAAAAGSALAGMTAREGFRSPTFLKLALAVFIFGVTCLALTVNAVPVLESRGLDRTAAAGIAGLLGIGSIVGRLGGGFLLDRFNAGKVAAVSVLAPIVSIVLLLALPGSDLAAGAAMLLLGLALGTEVDACSYLAASHFGMRAFGSLFGTINGIVAFGSGMAPVVANHVYDLAGSYDPVLWATIPLCAIASLLFLSLGSYPDFSESPAPMAGEDPRIVSSMSADEAWRA